MDKLLERPRAEAVFLAAACVFAVFYRCRGLFETVAGGVPPVSHISFDGVYYAQIARNIMYGDGFGWEAMTFPVLQPLLTALVASVSAFKNLSFISSVISQVAGIALLIPAYYLSRELYGRAAAAATLFVIIPYPHLMAISGGDTAESLYSFFIVLSLFLSYKALSTMRGRYLFYAGCSLGLTYLTRPEGLLMFSMVFLLAASMLWRGRKARPMACGLGLLAAGFLIFALPYMAFLTKSYGKPVLSSKLPYESVVMKSKVLDEPLMERDVDGLTEDGRLAWMEKGGAGLVLGYFIDEPGKFTRVYFQNLATELPWNVLNSTHLVGYPIVYPVYIWLLAALAFVLLLLWPDTRWKAFLIWTPFVNMLVYPVFTKGFWIYHAPYVPVLAMLAVGGACFISDRLKERVKAPLPLLALLVAVWFGYSAKVMFACTEKPTAPAAEISNFKAAISKASMRAGDWGRDNLGANATYMMEWSRLVYYLGGRWVFLPVDDDPNRIVEYGRKNRADYIVEELVGDEMNAGSRFVGVPDLEAVHAYRSEDAPYTAVFWKIRKTPDAPSVR